jgi:predicted nucleic acid-binding protein
MDSCIAIYSVQGEPGHRTVIKAAIASLAVDVYVSGWVRMESIVWPLRERNKTLLQAYHRFLNDFPCIGFKSTIFDHAAEMRADYGLRTADSLHIAAALSTGCDEFWTNDQKIAAKDLPIRVRLFPGP